MAGVRVSEAGRRDVVAVATSPPPGEPVVLARAGGLATVEAALHDGVLHIRAASLAASAVELAVRLWAGAGGREGRAELAPGASSQTFALAPRERATLQVVGDGPGAPALTVCAWLAETGTDDAPPVLVSHAVLPRP